MTFPRASMIAASLAAALVGTGCSIHTMQLKYEPTESLAVSRVTASKVSVGAFRDERGEDSTWFGAIRGGFGNPLKKLHSEQPIEAVVASAITDALRARQMLAMAGPAAARIEGIITKFDSNYYWNRDAHAYLMINVVDPESNATLSSQTYKTDNTEGGLGAGIFGDVDHLAAFAEKTLNQTIDKALSDPALLASLNGRFVAPSRAAADRLRELDRLRERGLITDQEYENKRAEILRGL